MRDVLTLAKIAVANADSAKTCSGEYRMKPVGKIRSTTQLTTADAACKHCKTTVNARSLEFAVWWRNRLTPLKNTVSSFRVPLLTTSCSPTEKTTKRQ